MVEPVQARRTALPEDQALQRIVHRGNTNTVHYRRAIIILASGGRVHGVPFQRLFTVSMTCRQDGRRSS